MSNERTCPWCLAGNTELCCHGLRFQRPACKQPQPAPAQVTELQRYKRALELACNTIADLAPDWAGGVPGMAEQTDIDAWFLHHATPAPTKPVETVTVAETLEEMIAYYDDCQLALKDCGIRYRDTLLALRLLVEAAECQRRVEDADCHWSASNPFHIGLLIKTYTRFNVDGRLLKGEFHDWPSAAEWAEQQDAERVAERAVKPTP